MSKQPGTGFERGGWDIIPNWNLHFLTWNLGWLKICIKTGPRFSYQWNENHVWSIKRWSKIAHYQSVTNHIISSITTYWHPANGNWWLAALPPGRRGSSSPCPRACGESCESSSSAVGSWRCPESGTGDFPGNFPLGYEMSFLSCRVFHFHIFHDGRKGTAFLSHDGHDGHRGTTFWIRFGGRIRKNTEQCFWFFGIEVPTQIL